jgi:hypothetical protein
VDHDRASLSTTSPWLVSPADPAGAEVQALLAELSQSLPAITGDAGFAAEDLNDPRAVLLVAHGAQGLACA